MKFSTIVTSICCFAVFLSSCQDHQKDYKIGVSQCYDSPWQQRMIHEMQREAGFHSNLSLDTRFVNDGDFKQQIKDVKQLIADSIDLLIINPINNHELTPIIDAVYDAGIPVVVIDRKVDSDKFNAFLAADNRIIGKTAADFIDEHCMGTASVFEITGPLDAGSSIRRHDGFVDEIKKHPTLHYAGNACGKWQKERAAEVTDSVLRVHPSINYIFSHSDYMVPGIYEALCRLHKEQTVQIIGVDALGGKGHGLDLIKEGQMTASLVNPCGGDKAIALALSLLKGDTVNKINLLPTAVVDKSNVELMEDQAEMIHAMDSKLSRLNSRLDDNLDDNQTQRNYILALCAIGILLIVIVLLAIRAYQMRQKHTEYVLKETDEIQQKAREQIQFYNDASTSLLETQRKLSLFYGEEQKEGDASEEPKMSNADVKFLNRFEELIAEKMGDPDLSVDQLSSDMGLSRAQLYRKVKALTTFTPVEIMRTSRLKRGRQLLLTTDKSIADVATEVGFSTSSYFIKCYHDEFGEKPTDSIKKTTPLNTTLQ